jgi:hypothetical protein
MFDAGDGERAVAAQPLRDQVRSPVAAPVTRIERARRRAQPFRQSFQPFPPPDSLPAEAPRRPPLFSA